MNALKILFASSEAVPFVKSGGLGEVAGTLPRALRLEGHRVGVILPEYASIAPDYKKRMTLLGKITVPVAWRRQYCGIKHLEYEGVSFYFLDNEYYFKREGQYGYFDDAERFAFFCRAVLQAVPYLHFSPDLIHCHDWQSALIPLFLQACYRHSVKSKTIFTIHNLKFQGVFTHWVLHNILGLGDEHFTSDKIEYHGQVNFLKAGIVYSDFMTTVSRTYAEEIKHPYYGEGLDGLIRAHEKKLAGIVNGIDYHDYNPQTDPRLAVNYRNPAQGKSLNKTRLQQELGLETNENTPLLAMVSRLTAQKGLDLLIHIVDEILWEEVQLVILGAGDAAYENILSQLASRHRQKMRLVLGFDEGLARRIYASSDIFLMPSMFEPCGLGQLIALRYGALPLVRETGGLKDTILSYNEITGEGNGFSFTNYNAHDFLFTVKRALSYYQKKEIWNMLMNNAVNCDYSWEKSAREYSRLYSSLFV